MSLYNWGQLRLLVRQTFPGLSLDLIDEAINTRYSTILDNIKWLGLQASGFIQATAPYQSSTDTVSLVSGSNLIQGVGTSWNSGQTGLHILLNTYGPGYVFTFVDATHATLDRPYEGPTESRSYFLVKTAFAFPQDSKTIISIQNPITGLPLAHLNDFDPSGLVGFGDPQGYYFSVSSDGLNQVEFYPRPITAWGFPVHFQVSAVGYDDTNLQSFPLPFVNGACLLAGARSDLYSLNSDTLRLAQVQEGKFTSLLAEMRKADARNQGPHRMKPAAWMSRHRLDRRR